MAPLDMSFSSAAPGEVNAGQRRFAFGGVMFEIETTGSSPWALPPASRDCALASSEVTCAQLSCRVRHEPALPALDPGDKGLSVWQPTAHGLSVRTAQCALEIAPAGPGRFTGSAALATPGAAAELLTLAACAVLESSGGLCLHATAVELGGKAILLLGPSGAGKTTAAQLLPGARCLAFDRVAVVPHRSGDQVWALPGGSPPRLERSAARVLPLAGFLRIAQAYEKPAVRALSAGEAALYLREAVEVGVGAGFLETRRLDAVSRLALAATGGKAEVVLGKSWVGELQSFLAAASHPREGLS